MLDYLYAFIRTDTIYVQSLYDTYVTRTIMGIDCAPHGLSKCSEGELKVLEDHRVSTLRQLGLMASKYYSSAWAVACTHHCFTNSGLYTDNAWKIGGASTQAAVHRFHLRQFTNGFFD